jgi:hypothetical protein
MAEHILQAYRVDIETRTDPDGNQRRFPDGWKVKAHEIKAGVISDELSPALPYWVK